MLSAHQIFRDAKENDLITTTRDRKLNAVDNPKSSGLKISTNINYGIKSNSDSLDNNKNKISRPMKSSEIELKMQGNILKNTKKSEDQEDWPEIENMFSYEEPEDDYEDILPKNERFTRDELYFFYGNNNIERYNDEDEEEDIPLPPFILEDLTDFYTPPSPVSEEDLYVDIPLELVPIPSPPKYCD